MNIDIVTRIKYQDLYNGMVASAKKYADKPFEAHCEIDKENLPLCSLTYNRLARSSKADIIGVIEDDVEFMSQGWDTIVKDIFKKYKPDILGVVGVTKYYGGYCFDSGFPYCVGTLACNRGADEYVKILSPYFNFMWAEVIDGMTMFINREWLLKNPFDEKFGEMWFYDLDLCLRSKKVGITCDVLVKHSTKGQDKYGVYPPKMKPVGKYWDKFHKKHHLNNRRVGDQRCAIIPLSVFKEKGQESIYNDFKHKYQIV